MEIGKLGVFCSMDAMPAPESASFCRRIERMGYRAVWTTEATGREPFAQGGYLLANTTSLIYATGIADVWVRDPMTMAVAAKTLAEQAPDRFILGIAVSHRSLVEDLRGHKYVKPFSYLSEYIPRMKSALYSAVAPKVEPPLVLAALYPKSLGLAAREAQGTHTVLCLPPHTKQARSLMGRTNGCAPAYSRSLNKTRQRPALVPASISTFTLTRKTSAVSLLHKGSQRRIWKIEAAIG